MDTTKSSIGTKQGRLRRKAAAMILLTCLGVSSTGCAQFFMALQMAGMAASLYGTVKGDDEWAKYGAIASGVGGIGSTAYQWRDYNRQQRMNNAKADNPEAGMGGKDGAKGTTGEFRLLPDDSENPFGIDMDFGGSTATNTTDFGTDGNAWDVCFVDCQGQQRSGFDLDFQFDPSPTSPDAGTSNPGPTGPNDGKAGQFGPPGTTQTDPA